MVCLRRVAGSTRFSSPRGCPRSRAALAGVTERLEGRTLLSGVVVGVSPGSTAAGLHYGVLSDEDGGAVMVRDYGTALSIGRPAGRVAAAAAVTPASGFDIVLNKGPNLRTNPAASAAFDAAAAFFESIFHDPITVVIDAEVAPLGGNQLGQANSVVFGDTFNTIRNAISDDANPLDEAILAQLPLEAGFLGTMPSGSFSLSGMAATRANLLALGVNPAGLTGPYSEYAATPNSVPRDAKIIFSSDYPFDYDRTNGISPGLSDFLGVAIHEIGHSLGFVSAVDTIDGQFSSGGAVAAMPLDLFRFEPGGGAANFAGGTRVLSPGSVFGSQVFYDGGLFDSSGISSIPGLTRGDVPFSTGAFNGDGRQASHWKDESFIGGSANTIGIMDPTAAEGSQVSWTPADERAFSLIGWDTAPAALAAGVSGTVYDDTNGNGSFQPALGESGLGGVTVYHDANNNGQFDSGSYTQSAPAINLPRAIRDFGTVNSRIEVEGLPGVVRDVNVTLSIEHTYTFDLDVTLISPGGRQVLLFSSVGEEDFLGRSMDFSGTVLDDEAGDSINFGSPPFTGAYRPAEGLSKMDGDTMNGAWTLRISDQAAQDEGLLLDWSLTFDTGEGEPSTVSEGDGTYTLTDLPGGNYRVRQVLIDGYRQTQPGANGAYVLPLADGQQVSGRNFGQAAGAPASLVVGRKVFYNRSAFDGRGAGADARDDDAIATDKQAMQPGMVASVSNYTNYTRGINGIMVDIRNLPAGDGLSAADFGFKVGNDNNVAGWQALSVAPTVSVRRGAGHNGSDRVTLIWPDNTIVRQWVEVTVKPTANTGLSNADVFYFGNLPGEVGNEFGNIRVTAADVMRVRSDIGAFDQPVDQWLDFNHDRLINTLDYAAARANVGRLLHVLAIPIPGAPAAANHNLFGDAPVAPRRGAYRPVRVWDETPAGVLA